MKVALERITAYQTPEDLKSSKAKRYGLPYEEVLEMCYENVKAEAENALTEVEEAT